jgi:hypothetical protein
MHEVGNGVTDVIHVDAGRVRVETDGVELIAVLNRHFGESLEIPPLNRLCYTLHPFWNEFGHAVLEELTRLNTILHSARTARLFLIVTHLKHLNLNSRH